ncbi:SH3 domain-containing protein 19-like [Sinocyclocheilus grahami]|uniref:SH3 domain-containing protein 19-like n=1 Tax=Sinocyclocheilus grahami TaxID=75366 RepID=UPI0007AC603F|nr:PREDICTED: SH3 domain-containing protein 19-like [Sinocyclocheilus grahami]
MVLAQLFSEAAKETPWPSLPCKPVSQETLTRSLTSTPNSQPTIDLASTTHPLPQPRSKTKPLSPSNQVNAQPLIPLQDSWEVCPVTPVETSDAHSGNYLQELLDVFSSEPQSELSNSVNIQGEQTNQTKENQSENMTSLHNDRNIRSRIQAFESQSNAENEETSMPFPRPRKVFAKPPALAPKPSIALRPSVKKPKEEQLSQFVSHLYEEVNTPPMPAPRPQLFKKPSLDSRDDSNSQPSFRAALIPPSRSSLIRVKNVLSQDEEVVLKEPHLPLKPSKDLLNLNNHNSTALLSNITFAENMLSNNYVDAPTNHSPSKPARQVGFNYMGPNMLGVIKRPTIIRVPSKTDKYPEETAEVPTPTPAQPSHKDSFSLSSAMSLPPRPSGGKVLPPRPSPAKTGPGRPPPPRNDGSQRRPSDPGFSQIVPSKQQQPQWQQQNPRASKKGPALPPRPNPGHRLYNRYTLEIPHGIAEFDYNGTNTGELSFQKNEVLVLLEELDSKTFECQVGNAKGRVQKTHMKIITPLTNVLFNSAPQKNSSFSGMVENTGSLRMQALYDFTPGIWWNKPGTSAPASSNEWQTKPSPEPVRGPRCVGRFDFEGEQSDELSFSEGDVIRLKEYVGDEWARGEVNGQVGIFPLNFVEVLEDFPPAPVQKSAPNKIALPGMAGSSNTRMSYKTSEA